MTATEPTAVEQRAIDYLRQHPGGVSAGCVGAHLWPVRQGHVISSNGGGDYAAQMLLGRMRKKGWCYVVYGTGSSQWAITSAAPLVTVGLPKRGRDA